MGESLSWSASPWTIIMCVSLGVGVVIIAEIIRRIWSRSNVPQTMVEWYPVLEGSAMQIIHCNRELMEAVRVLHNVRHQLPDEYKHIADQVMRFAQIAEEAAYDEAVERGVVPRYWFGGPPVEAAPSVPMPVSPPPLPAVVEQQPDNVVQLIGREWINGQLLRRVGA